MPIYQGFTGPSNQTQSPIADGERTVNWLLEPIQSPYAPTGMALFPTPGMQAYVEVSPDINARAIFAMDNRAFVVVGSGLYEVLAPTGYVRRGTVAQDANKATISSNGRAGDQLFITSGGNGYCYDLSTNTLTQVLTGEATMGGMKDGYFLAFNATNGRVRLSDLNDGLTWNPTQFFARSIAPDPWKAMIVANPLIWMIGEQTSEAWYNAGTFPQPFAPNLSSFINYGTSAGFSASLAGEFLSFLSNTAIGGGVIVGGVGYNIQPISNYAVNTSIAAIERTVGITDCESLTYQEDGHTFVCFSFPSGNQTWVLDVEAGAWHERGTWNAPQTRYDAWHPRVHAQAFGKHLVGTRTSGVISEMDTSYGYEANGDVIRRLRIPPPLWAMPTRRIEIARLDLFMDTGLGNVSGLGQSPAVMMRGSYDGVRWGNQRTASAGAAGAYGQSVFFTRCGSSRKLWVPEIVVSDPTPWRLLGASVDGAGMYQMAKAS